MTTRLIFTGLITYSYVHGGYFISPHDNLHNMNNQPEINGKTQIHINVVAILLGLCPAGYCGSPPVLLYDFSPQMVWHSASLSVVMLGIHKIEYSLNN